MAYSLQGAFFGQNSSRGMENPGDDLRMLASVLQDIMPVLARIQTRSPQTAPTGSSGPMSVEAAASVALVSDLGADSLRRLTAYLDANAGKHEGLENCAPLVAAAARALAGRDYAQSFTLLFDVYRTIAMLRIDNPKLPLPGSMKNVAMDETRRTGEDEPDSSRDRAH